ncbi:hypothetical protein [Kitasatospora griseola]|uniref:hypothetical protein n=1 Tax=Kitasatospora griseola TaxID=2064 RepID=UPI001670D139|nr:hypothetical protein [Kitasatospora griseola]
MAADHARARITTIHPIREGPAREGGEADCPAFSAEKHGGGTVPQKARRGWPQSTQLLGETEQANALARLMSSWRDTCGLTGMQVFSALTSEHFADGKLPSKTTFYEMLKGKALSWEFIEALADVCSGALKEQQEWIASARVLWGEHVNSPTAVADPTATEVLVLQKQLISSQEELLKIRELYAATKEELVAADRKVVALTALVAQLESQVTMLKQHQVELLVQREPNSAQVGEAKQRLESADRQRVAATTQLGRAQNERERALTLATRATVQTAELQEKVMELRAVSGREVSDELTEPLPSLVVGGPAILPAFTMTGDVPTVLADITDDLEAAANRLDEVTEQLGRTDRAGEPVPDNEKVEAPEAIDAEVAESVGESEAGDAAPKYIFTLRERLPGQSPEPKPEPVFSAKNKQITPESIMRLADVARHEPHIREELREAIRAAAGGFTFPELTRTTELLHRVKDNGFASGLLLQALGTTARSLPYRQPGRLHKSRTSGNVQPVHRTDPLLEPFRADGTTPRS